MLKEKLLYKSSVLIINENFYDLEKITKIISNETKFRILSSNTVAESNKSTKRKRIDIILLSHTLFNTTSSNEKNITELKKLTKFNSTAIFLVFFKTKITNKTNFDKYFKIIPSFIPITLQSFNKKQFLLNLLNANYFAKINNDNKSNSLKLQNLFNENRKMLSRLEQFVEKENERAVVYNSYKENIIDKTKAELALNSKDNKLLANKQLDDKKNDSILEKLSLLFKKLNKLNDDEKISLELEQKIPNILDIKKFSIFLIGKEFRDLKHFTSSNFNGIKKNRLSIEDIFEKSVMFDTIFKREVIYLKNYNNSKFSMITETDNEYIKYSNTDSLCIPLMSGNKIIGVANFNDSKQGSFSKNQLNHISMFANYVAILLDNILPQIENKEKLDKELND